MLKNGVSGLLYSTIKQLSNLDSLKDFYLGGGTNLAIRYNHRVSTDIDFFSKEVVGIDSLNNIIKDLEHHYGKENLIINKRNSDSENLSWLQIFIVFKEERIKLDIIQNITLYYPIELIDGIRLINEKDIGSLKLLSLSDRGIQKDFYDLVLLSGNHSIIDFYNDLIKRDLDENRIKNIFDSGISNPYLILKKSLNSLVDFSKAGDKKSSGNQIKLTSASTLSPTFINLRKLWIREVEKLGESMNIKIIPNLQSNQKKYKRNRGI